MLSTRQERLIACLLTCDHQRTACVKAGVSEPSLYRWLRDPAFRQALDQAREQFRSRKIAELARQEAQTQLATVGEGD